MLFGTANALIRKTDWESTRYVTRIWYIYAACIGFSYLLGWAINDWKIEEAHWYVARAIPVLEQIRASEGAYPSEIPIGKLGALPALLRSPGKLYGFHGSSCYQSDGREFYFHFVDPASVFGDGEMYNSDAGFWTDALSD